MQQSSQDWSARQGFRRGQEKARMRNLDDTLGRLSRFRNGAVLGGPLAKLVSTGYRQKAATSFVETIAMRRPRRVEDQQGRARYSRRVGGRRYVSPIQHEDKMRFLVRVRYDVVFRGGCLKAMEGEARQLLVRWTSAPKFMPGPVHRQQRAS